MNNLYLTPLQLEQEFDISDSTQKVLRRDKKIPYFQIGRKIYYNINEIYSWIESHRIV